MATNESVVQIDCTPSKAQDFYRIKWAIKEVSSVKENCVVCSEQFSLLQGSQWIAKLKKIDFKNRDCLWIRIYDLSDSQAEVTFKFTLDNINRKLRCIPNVSEYPIPPHLDTNIKTYSFRFWYTDTYPSSSVDYDLSNFPNDTLLIHMKITCILHHLSTEGYQDQPAPILPSLGLKTFTNNLKTVDNDADPDVMFKVRDCKLYAHKSLLSRRSKVFENLLQTKNVVQVDDIKPNVFRLLLKHLYTGSLREDNFDTVTGLYCAAHKYNLFELQHLCGDVLLSKLTVENAADLLSLANQYGDSKMFNKIDDFIKSLMCDSTTAELFKRHSSIIEGIKSFKINSTEAKD